MALLSLSSPRTGRGDQIWFCLSLKSPITKGGRGHVTLRPSEQRFHDSEQVALHPEMPALIGRQQSICVSLQYIRI